MEGIILPLRQLGIVHLYLIQFLYHMRVRKNLCVTYNCMIHDIQTIISIIAVLFPAGLGN